MRNKLKFEWEIIGEKTKRVQVPGGWIVETHVIENKSIASSSVFIPDRNHAWKVLPSEESKSEEIENENLADWNAVTPQSEVKNEPQKN